METFIREIIEGEKFELLIDTQIFNKDIILKTAYTFLDRGYFFFKTDVNGNIILQLTRKNGNSELLENIIVDFSDELLNNVLREKLFQENKDIRTKIITSAIENSLREAELPNDWKGYDNVDSNYFCNSDDDIIDFDRDIDEILKEIENDPELKIDEEEIEKILKEIEEETMNEDETQKSLNISVNIQGVEKAKDNFKNLND